MSFHSHALADCCGMGGLAKLPRLIRPSSMGKVSGVGVGVKPRGFPLSLIEKSVFIRRKFGGGRQGGSEEVKGEARI